MKIKENIEIWKAIPGYEGKYEVSTHGRVRSLPHHVRLVIRGKGYLRLSPGRILKPGKTKSGHVSVSLGRHNSKLVHYLVLLAFVGERPKNYDILHLNGIPDDNRLQNLKYGSRRENLLQDYRTGIRKLTKEHWTKAYLARLAKGFKHPTAFSQMMVKRHENQN